MTDRVHMGSELAFHDDLVDGPGLHALIVGVSDYQNLPSKKDPRPRSKYNTLGLLKLSCAARSAYRLYHWLVQAQDGLPQRLKSCRLLLSPTECERDGLPPGLKFAAATRANFVRAAHDWRIAAGSHRDNVALFYFAGHGLAFTSISDVKDILLLQDAFDVSGTRFEKTALLNNLYVGMGFPDPHTTGADVASRQLFLLDMCRTWPPELEGLPEPDTPTVFEYRGMPRAHEAPMLCAAMPDAKAWGVEDDESFFIKGLMACLERGQAARPPDVPGRAGVWEIKVTSIYDAMNNHFEDLTGHSPPPGPHGSRVFDQPHGTGSFLVHTRKRAPEVKVKFSIEPAEARGLTHVHVFKEGTDHPIETIPFSTPGLPDPYPYVRFLSAGEYLVDATIDHPGSAMYRGRERKRETFLPPVWPWSHDCNGGLDAP